MTHDAVAWNGIGFRAPAPWQVARLSSRYLLLEDSGRPVMEVRWGAAGAGGDLRRCFRRLNRDAARDRRIRLTGMPLPKTWERALSGYETRGFQWAGPNLQGVGVVLQCTVCRHLSMIQFYGGPPDDAPGIRERVLASYQDHPIDGRIAWSIFGLKLTSSADFRLLGHRFEPGYAELGFRSAAARLTFYRWGPASVLLKGRTLSHFAGAMSQPALHTAADESDEILGTNVPVPGSFRYAWLQVKPGYSFRRYRLWRDRAHNRVLATLCESRRPALPASVKSMLDSYETT